MARIKKYKIGDRIFYEDCDGNIQTAIVRKVRDDWSKDTYGREFKYRMLYLDEHLIIEDYACLPYSDSRVKELVKQYKQYDKDKAKIQEEMEKLLNPFSDVLKREILTELSLKYNQ